MTDEQCLRGILVKGAGRISTTSRHFRTGKRIDGKRPVADAREAGSLAFMIELAGYTFPPNRASIVCTHVWNGDPVLLFVHDNDGDIQFYCGEEGHSGADAMVLGLAEVSNHLLTMQDIPTVKPGFCAERELTRV